MSSCAGSFFPSELDVVLQWLSLIFRRKGHIVPVRVAQDPVITFPRKEVAVLELEGDVFINVLVTEKLVRAHVRAA